MKSNYVKRTQKDYTEFFKVQVVSEIERGELTRSRACDKYGIQAKSTIREWLKKYGNFDWENQSYSTVLQLGARAMNPKHVEANLSKSQLNLYYETGAKMPRMGKLSRAVVRELTEIHRSHRLWKIEV